MCRINRFVITIIQFVLLVDSTKQSKVKQGISILKTIGSTIKKPISKTIGNTIKNSMGMFSQKTNNIKNIATKSVKYLREGALHKQKVPQGVRGGNKLLRTGSKKNTQMRSAEQMRENGLRSLVNMVSKSKPQLPFLFAAGGFTKLSHFNLVPENDVVVERLFDKNGVEYFKKPFQRTKLKFFDTAANMSAEMYNGNYRGDSYHDEDFEHVMKRANRYGVDKFLFVGGSLAETLAHQKLCEGRKDCWTTVGVHPARTHQIEQDGGKAGDYIEKMENLILSLGNKCSAIGRCGLDYTRQKYADKVTQLKYFPMHFDLAKKFNLPMYLYARNAGYDFVNTIKANRSKFPGGAVHSFTGTEEQLDKIIDMGLYVSINGCSLKNEETIEMVKRIPLERIMLETDAPYGEIRNTYAGHKYLKTRIPFVKDKQKWSPEHMILNRNEPCKIIQVCEAVAAIKGVPQEELASVAYENSCKIFAREK